MVRTETMTVPGKGSATVYIYSKYSDAVKKKNQVIKKYGTNNSVIQSTDKKGKSTYNVVVPDSWDNEQW